jgi:prepilin-type N-terminal cleavage/methylation domain-containing protein
MMTRNWNKYWSNSPRDGLTLIEVVVGLLLLSTLLAGLLLSHGRHARQVQLAQRKLAAIESADQLLADWFAAPDGIPVPATGKATGRAPGPTSLWWETFVADTRHLETLGALTVRVLIREGEPGDDAAQPLVDLSLLTQPPRAEGSPSG